MVNKRTRRLMRCVSGRESAPRIGCKGGGGGVSENNEGQGRQQGGSQWTDGRRTCRRSLTDKVTVGRDGRWACRTRETVDQGWWHKNNSKRTVRRIAGRIAGVTRTAAMRSGTSRRRARRHCCSAPDVREGAARGGGHATDT